MAMDKQTKQLAVLGGLVVVMGIVAYFMVFKGEDAPPPAPGPIDKSAPPTPAGGASGTPTPAPGTTPGATPAAAPQVQQVDPEMPTVLEWRPARYEWTWAPPIGRADWRPNLERGERPVFDPLRVRNMDVVDPERQASINKIKDEWRLVGIIDRAGLVPVDRQVEVLKPKKDDAGNDVLGPDGKVIMEVEMIEETEPVMVPDVDSEGNQLYDAEGAPLMRPQLNENGEPEMKVVLDESGKPKMIPRMKTETVMVPGRVLEAWFEDKRRPYTIKDRLPNTRFTVQDIFIGKQFLDETTKQSSVRSGVVLLGDTGAEITIFLTNDSRYDDD